MKQIDDHFKNLSDSQFEANIIKAGIEHIKPSGLQIISEEK